MSTEMTAIYCKNQMELMNTVCGQIDMILNVKEGSVHLPQCSNLSTSCEAGRFLTCRHLDCGLLGYDAMQFHRWLQTL